MANHLTPNELADALGMRTERIVRYCHEQAIPIYQGRVDKTLLISSMITTGHRFAPEVAEGMLAA